MLYAIVPSYVNQIKYHDLIVTVKRNLRRHENIIISKLHKNDLPYFDEEVKVNQHCKLFVDVFHAP